MLSKKRPTMTLTRRTILLFFCFFSMALTLPSKADAAGLYNYKVTYKNCNVEMEMGSKLYFTEATSKSTVKIRALKKQPTGDPKDGVIYFSGQSIPLVVVIGELRTFFSEAPVNVFATLGVIRSLTMKNSHAENVYARHIGSIKMNAFMNDAGPTPTYARTSIETWGLNSMNISLTGVILENLDAPRWIYYPSDSLYWQPPVSRVTVKVASKAWKNVFKQRYVSLSGVGRVTPEADPFEGICGIYTVGLRSISAKGASIAPDVILSTQPLSKLKAKSALLAGVDYPGHVGLPDAWSQMLVLAPEVRTVYGSAGVAAKFWAGFDARGHTTYEGAVKSIGTKKGVGALSGEIHMSSEAKPTNFKPDQGAFQIVAKKPGAPNQLIKTTTVLPSVFTMGAGESEGNLPMEVPRHQVALSAYEIGLYEFTVGQACEVLNWAYGEGLLQNSGGGAYVGGNIYAYNTLVLHIDYFGTSIVFANGNFAPAVRDGLFMQSYPLAGMRWEGAFAFCNWLSEIEGLTPCYDLATMDAIDASTISDGLQFQDGYRLPTEAEWERAAAWGGIGHMTYGFTNWFIDTNRCNYLEANPMNFTNDPFHSPVGWYNGANGTADSPSPVGCYDMSGNVAEFCYDRAHFYTGEPQKNPTGPTSPTGRIMRGGFYSADGASCRTAWRAEGNASIGVGFRMARSR